MPRYEISKIQAQYKILPSALKEAMIDPDITEKMSAIGKNHSLTIEKVGFLAEEVGYVILGLTKPMEFLKIIQDRLEVDGDTAKQMAMEVNHVIFAPIRQVMRETHKEDMNFESIRGAEPLIRKPVPLNSMLGIKPENHDVLNSTMPIVPQSSTVQPAAPRGAAMPVAPPPLTPPSQGGEIQTSSPPYEEGVKGEVKLQMNPNLPPPRPSVALSEEGPRSTVAEALEDKARDVESHPFFQKAVPPKPSAYQEPIEEPAADALRQGISQIPELNMPGRPTTPQPLKVSVGPEMSIEEPEPVKLPPLPPPAPGIPSAPVPMQEIPHAPISFIKPIGAPRPIPMQPLRPSVAFGEGGKNPPIDLRELKKTPEPPAASTAIPVNKDTAGAATSSQGGKERLASAINLKDLPPIPTPSAFTKVPADPQALTDKPADPSAPAGTSANLAAILSSPMPNSASANAAANITQEPSPANVRRMMEEREELAKTSAPPAIKPQQGDPYREAVD